MHSGFRAIRVQQSRFGSTESGLVFILEVLYVRVHF